MFSGACVCMCLVVHLVHVFIIVDVCASDICVYMCFMVHLVHVCVVHVCVHGSYLYMFIWWCICFVLDVLHVYIVTKTWVSVKNKIY